MNNDVVQEILLHLPVCNPYIIDSPSFRKLHTHNNDDNNNNGTVCLELKFLIDNDKQQHCKLSIKLLDNGKSFTLPHNLDEFLPDHKYVRFAGPVKGLICIYPSLVKVPAIAICNPFLGQFKILPRSPFPQCGGGDFRREPHVGIGFDGDNCKVVELVFCHQHGRNHARVYSGGTDSWRELAGDGVLDQLNNLRIVKPVKSTSKNGYFAHWMGWGFLLTFDMRNEVFRATELMDGDFSPTTKMEIFAKEGEGEGEDSFLLFNVRCQGPMVEIYEKGHGKKKKRKMNYVKAMAPKVKLGKAWLWRRGHYVALKHVYVDGGRMRREVNLFDYFRRKFVGRFELPESLEDVVEYIEYVGSFVSLEKGGVIVY